MKVAAGALVCLVFLSGATHGAERRPVVAVFDVNAQRFKLARAQRRMLTELMAEELGVGGVFQVMPPGDVKKAILEQTRESYKECYNESCQIELGRQLPANKLLTSTVRKIGPKCRVTGSLYDLKRQTTDIVAREAGGCREVDLIRSVEKVAARIRAWGAGGADEFKEERLGEEPSEWEVGAGGEVIVRFKSDPQGAVVLVDGGILCRETPCSKSLKKGRHLVAMKAERHLERKERLLVSEGTDVTWKLTPNFGWLTVRSEPSGLSATVNGTPAGRTPLERSEREPGVYRVLVKSPCHYDAGKKVKIGRGEEEVVSVSLKEKQGAVRVKAMDKKGNDIAAEVFVDGRKLGRAPGTYKVSVCAKELEIRHRKHGTARKPLSIREREVASVEVKLEGGGGVDWVYSRPAGIDFTRSEITVAQYRACVEAGKCTEPKSKSDNKYCNWGHSGRDNHPINCVDWNQATAFCGWAGGRLPTEKEWYAEASNGGKREYPWGNQKVTCDYAVMDQGGDGCGRDSTWPVCSKPAGNSISGLCDMSGNLWEWTSSLYKSGSSARVARGGSWPYDDPENFRASSRSWSTPAVRVNRFGFRCGRSSR